MFCSNCGKKIDENAEMCENCGTPIPKQDMTDNTPQTGKKEIKKRKPNFIAVGGAAALALGAFLPFASISFFGMKNSISLIDGGDGVFFIILAVIAAALSMFGKNIGVTVTGILSAALALFEADNIKNNDSEYAALINKEVGYYLLILGAIVILGAGIYGIISKKKAKN